MEGDKFVCWWLPFSFFLFSLVCRLRRGWKDKINNVAQLFFFFVSAHLHSSSRPNRTVRRDHLTSKQRDTVTSYHALTFTNNQTCDKNRDRQQTMRQATMTQATSKLATFSPSTYLHKRHRQQTTASPPSHQPLTDLPSHTRQATITMSSRSHRTLTSTE